MYLAGPKGPTEKRNAELIGGLSLVGTKGTFCAVLTERQLTIERFDGKGVRLDLAAIDRMRHLKVPLLPAGIAPLGLLAIYLGISTIVSPWKWLAIVMGILVVTIYFLTKYSILAIETGSGDRHLISGEEGNLLKLCMMVDRVRHGSTIEEALLGLEGLETELPTFPALRDAKGLLPIPAEMLSKPSSSASVEPEMGVSDNTVKIEEPIVLHEPTMSAHFESQDGDFETVQTSLDQHSPVVQHSPVATSTKNAYERAWPGKQTPSWYVENNLGDMKESRIDSAVSDAAQGLDLFASGGIFDTDSSAVTHQEREAPPSIGFGDLESTPTPAQEQRGMSSAQMIKLAHSSSGTPGGPYISPMLPPPTEEAVREECRAGVVRQAKAKRELRHRKSFENLQQPANLEEYPALNRLAATMGSNRVSSGNRRKREFSSGWLGRLLRPSSALTRSYPPSRANAGATDKKQERGLSRFQTAQHMRLRNDQNHQVEVGARIRSMQTATGASSARGALDSIVSRMASGEDFPPRLLETSTNSLRFNQLKPTSTEEDPHPLPGIRRLG
ncbi:MAG: hypothetical protein QGF28_02380 [Candidatus Thalassarchaeaceae archaeon]|jgi:hypothetical protein|nr:hypothetical protein [Euryarchaeota archaeon]MDP7092063.1 hypothetical protein [Candidatus Thalassarchaeaceae archaeon]MDP7256795.1 hypothetical protein [Candidatus Thalassarchaeaceae archaeon]MDP7446035.1 hypothetical protein [Candidatus Thalassarchaeaceae archaeon]MDP7649523.1 hypothetical protein [Candidatus Thalassarchaeaceae archaeon]|tara:strand:+ start:1694 stop:3364 length:1671 start_codon:yes stop_codon:yes gene_type:complete